MNTKVESRLNRIGIYKLIDLIKADTNTLREGVDLSGFTQQEMDSYLTNIERWRDMAELYQIKGVGSQYADLLVEVGENLHSLRSFTGDPEELLDKIEEYNDLNNDVSKLPSLKDIIDWMEQARSL